MLKKIVCLLCSFLWLGNVFSQNSALWLRYPSISPDGQQIAFSYQGNIYLVSSKGGQARPLTLHAGHDIRPVWSADGQYLAFSSNRFGSYDVFVMPSKGGQAQRLTDHSGNEYPSCFSSDGKKVVFSANMEKLASSLQFPTAGFTELYQVPINGGRAEQLLPNAALDAQISPDGQYIVYHDWKGYEDPWRKHHTSSVTRDIWLYEQKTKQYKQISAFEGEDRTPVFSKDGQSIYYLSEQFGDFNIVKKALFANTPAEQITKHDKHPVRSLSIANDQTLCYSFDGKLFTLAQGGKPTMLNVQIDQDGDQLSQAVLRPAGGATEFEISPNGKEIVFVYRGDVYVSAVDFSTTKRITNTAEQERSASFSPDGRSIIYASERGNSWKIFQTKLVRKDEPFFYASTLLEESPVVATDKESFQPKYSPDGKEVAFLEERTTLRVINLESKQVRTILDNKYFYSYSDGDQWFEYSPCGQWFLVTFLSPGRWSNEVGLVDAKGEQKLVNLTESGYEDSNPKWIMKGNAMLWFSDKYGMRSHGSWGSQNDVMAMFFNRESFQKFTMSKEDIALLKAQEEANKKTTTDEEKQTDPKDKKDKKDPKKGDKDIAESDKKETVNFEFEHLKTRTLRLTMHSSDLADAVLTPDGEKLFYLSSFEGGYDLWVHDLKENATKLLVKLNGSASTLSLDKEGKNLFLMSNNSIIRVNTDTKEQKHIGYQIQATVDLAQERAYFFEHIWRQVDKKFYDPEIQGVDWKYYKESYSKFLPHINNNYDFAEMLAELLGELNASHTGASYRYPNPQLIPTARLGLLYDPTHRGDGLKIAEVIAGSPLEKVSQTPIQAGMLLWSVDGKVLTEQVSPYEALNGKAGKSTLLVFKHADKMIEVVVRPISIWEENELLYTRWVRLMEAQTAKFSNGKIGYAHVRGMNDASFREVYATVLGGQNAEKEGIIMDSRFNGGGWLHDDLATLLSGQRYIDFTPRGQYIGSEPGKKWYKKSVVLMSESNYSDAHGFPLTYKALGIGKLIGMPVPGTMTAVWWEFLHDGYLRFGIPQVGVRDLEGNYQENKQLEPDVKVRQTLEKVLFGHDEQIEKAVEELLKD